MKTRERVRRGVVGVVSVSVALVLSGCAAGGASGPEADDGGVGAWFEQHCPGQGAEVREADPETQESVGDLVGTAMVQGAIRPPSSVGSKAEVIRYLDLEESTDELVPVGEVQSGDVVCFEQGLRAPERRLGADTPVRGAAWDGSLLFTKVRSPEYPDGVWIDWKFSGVETAPGAFLVDGSGVECAGEWTAAVDMTPLDGAEGLEESIIPLNVTGAGGC